MNYLIIRFSSLGDVVLTTAIIKNIRETDPDAVIDILTKKEYAPVFDNNPYVNRVITGLSKSIKYDYLLDLHCNIRSNMYKYLFSAKARLGYENASYARRMFLHTKVKNEILEKTVIERYQEPLKSIGFNVHSAAPSIYVSDEEFARVKDQIPESDYIAIAPGAKWAAKEWMVEGYISLLVRIIREFKLDIVIIGSETDKELATEIYKGTGLLKKHVKNLAGETGIRDLAAIIKSSRLLVTTDSGPMHIGWATGVKVVALFGPTVREFGFQPKDENVTILEKDMECRPCSLHGSKECKFKDRACMQRIEVFEVFNAIKKLL